MKIQILSDIHLETRNYDMKWFAGLKEPGVDVAIFAGDIMNLRNPKQVAVVLSAMSEFASDVLYVAGNHEYYGTNPSRACISLAKALADVPSNIHTNVESEAYDTWIHPGGQRFVFGTMWYGREAVRKVADLKTGMMARTSMYFSDYFKITNLVPWVYEQNNSFTDWIEDDLGPEDIVVTHHLPSFRSVHPRFAGLSENVFYVHDLETVIMDRQPKMWIHGHGHDPNHYWIGKTEVVSNPVGYPGEKIHTSLVLDV